MNRNKASIIQTKDYVSFFETVKKQIQTTQTKIIQQASHSLVQLYLHLGECIVRHQEKHGWGKSIVEQLSKDLKAFFPKQQGFSPQNLWYMRQVYLEYREYPKLQQLVGELPWGQNLVIMSKIKDLEEREYYLKATKEMGWSRAVLTHQIKNNAYERHATADKQHNFQKALPQHLAEQAHDVLKDTYLFDMLNITEPVLEAELERRMVNKIKSVMLELGYGFAFIDSQYRLVADGHEYFIDLLFFNRRLKSLVAVELKVGKYKPEYAGKMNFYLNLLNEYVKEPGENPAIGIILCSDRDRFEVEFSLKGIEKPVGVAEYQLVDRLPATMKDKLPEPEQLAETLREQMALEQAQHAKEQDNE